MALDPLLCCSDVRAPSPSEMPTNYHSYRYFQSQFGGIIRTVNLYRGDSSVGRARRLHSTLSSLKGSRKFDEVQVSITCYSNNSFLHIQALQNAYEMKQSLFWLSSGHRITWEMTRQICADKKCGTTKADFSPAQGTTAHTSNRQSKNVIHSYVISLYKRDPTSSPSLQQLMQSLL